MQCLVEAGKSAVCGRVVVRSDVTLAVQFHARHELGAQAALGLKLFVQVAILHLRARSGTAIDSRYG